ncbi:uncharacterized protein LOC142519527 [Primulina tabacum]|uniref:uncharacterized protein LOC142519527 n=1 Tax=Primulina tabacum TaxID=48773 RepID=UPI003F594F77
MFLGSLYRWLNVTVNDTTLSKLNGAMWILQVWLFSYFPELASLPGSLTEHLSWKDLMSYQSDFTVADIFSFFQSLPFDRPACRPLCFTIKVEDYPWIEHMATVRKTAAQSIVDAVRVTILHPRFLVCDGTSPRDQSTHSFEFYNPTLYLSQLGLCLSLTSRTLHLPHSINDMMKTELSQKNFTSLSLIDLSEQAKFFKNPIIEHPITVSDGYSDWWDVRYTSLVPTALKLSDVRKALDLSVA